MEIVAPLARLFPAGKGVQVMASAAVRNGRGELQTNTSMLLLQKIESGAEASGAVFQGVSFLAANEQ